MSTSKIEAEPVLRDVVTAIAAALPPSMMLALSMLRAILLPGAMALPATLLRATSLLLPGACLFLRTVLRLLPARPLLVAVFAIVAVAAGLPYTALAKLLQLTPLPLSSLGAIAFLAVTYLLLVQAVKSWFYRRHALL